MKRYIKYLLLLSVILFSSVSVFSQTYTLNNALNNTTVNTCGGTFYDSGGGGGNYGNNQNRTVTFCSSNASQAIYLNFSQFNIENNWDFMYIYDGPSTASPSLGTYTGINSPGTIWAPSGCITIRFTSDQSIRSLGWVANIGCGTLPLPTVQDCDGAIPVCQDIYAEAVSYSGEGNYPNEINGSLSCLGGETNSVWYVFTVQTSGNLSFDITPNNLNDDYDWAVYDLTNNDCSDIFTNSSLELSCNYSLNSGITGANGGSTLNSQGFTGSNDNSTIPVTVGDILYLAVQNWTGSTNGYDINFSTSTAAVFDDTEPFIQAVTTPVDCGETTLSFNFSETILCSSFDVSDLELTGPGGPYTLSDLSGAACVGGVSQENNFTVTVSSALPNSGTFSLCLLAGSSPGDLCGNSAPAACLDFDIVNDVTVLAAFDQSICEGVIPNSLLSLGSTSGNNYSWFPSSDFINSNMQNPVFSNVVNTTTTYTVTFTDFNGCIATDSVTITVFPITPTNSINHN
jgi:hypothetical protein